MNRRNFFKRAAGVVVGAAVAAPVIADAVEAQPGDGTYQVRYAYYDSRGRRETPYTHREFGAFVEMNHSDLARCAKALAKAARKREEDLAMKLFATR